MKKIIVLSIVLLGFSPLTQANMQCPQEAIREKIKQIASTISGTVGVSALHLERNENITFNGAQLFPMASTYKIPIAIHTLMLIERGALDFDSTIILAPCDLRQDSELINKQFKNGQTNFSVEDLFVAMMQNSDNTATDALLNLYGNSPNHITKYLQTAGIDNITISRSVHHMIVDFYSMPRNENCDAIIDFEKHADLDDLPQPHETEERFYNDLTRDVATPCAMTGLLAAFIKEQLVTKFMVDYLIKIMEGCKNGPDRIKHFLPPEISIAHKTGTIAGVVNDVGIITLPNGEHIILTIFINGSNCSSKAPEECKTVKFVIASIAKQIFDYFTSSSQSQEKEFENKD